MALQAWLAPTATQFKMEVYGGVDRVYRSTMPTALQYYTSGRPQVASSSGSVSGSSSGSGSVFW